MHLEKLEHDSIFIIREAFASFKNIGMLWSMGKDSTVLLWLVRKAFLGRVPFPLIHIDTHFKIPDMIAFRNQLAKEWNLPLVVVANTTALEAKQTFPDGNVDPLACCRKLKRDPLMAVIHGAGERFRFNAQSDMLEADSVNKPFDAIFVGIRSDEEGSRSKERVFSPRHPDGTWDKENQPPELWEQFNSETRSDAHVRVHPLLEWREIDIWRYIARERIPVIPLYFANKVGFRYRSIGCYPCTKPVASMASCVDDVIQELSTGDFALVPERAGRWQDKQDRGTLESLRSDGYM